MQFQVVLKVALLCELLLTGKAMKKLVAPSCDLVQHNAFHEAFVFKNLSPLRVFFCRDG